MGKKEKLLFVFFLPSGERKAGSQERLEDIPTHPKSWLPSPTGEGGWLRLTGSPQLGLCSHSVTDTIKKTKLSRFKDLIDFIKQFMSRAASHLAEDAEAEGNCGEELCKTEGFSRGRVEQESLLAKEKKGKDKKGQVTFP